MNPAQIIFHDVRPSPAVFVLIQRQLALLAGRGAKIKDCRVTIAAPHLRSRHGASFNVQIELHLPRKEIVVHHTPPSRRPDRSGGAAAKAAHQEIYTAVKDAFAIADRLLVEHKRAKLAGQRRRLTQSD